MKIKVLNLNIWIGGILWDEMMAFLKQEDPDILLTQEIYNGDDSFKKKQYRSFSELKQKLGFEYALFAPTFSEDSDELDETGKFKEVIQGNAVFSKLPISEVSTTFYDVSFGKRDPDDAAKYHVTPRSLQHVTVDINGKDLHVLNTQGIWGEHGGDTDRRLEMADHILEEAGTHEPLLLAGDLNIHEKTKTIDKLREKLVSVFYDDMITSFNLPRKDLVKGPGYSTSVVDMMFVSSEITVLNKKLPKVDVSDHMPLICEIEV